MNKFLCIGRLCKDAELKYTSNNLAMTMFPVAINRKFCKQGEERKADFLNCKAFGKMAEHINKYFKKGDMINIIGRIEIDQLEQNGAKVYFTNLMIDEVNFCGSNSNGNNQKSNGQSNNTTNQDNDQFYPVVDDDTELPF